MSVTRKYSGGFRWSFLVNRGLIPDDSTKFQVYTNFSVKPFFDWINVLKFEPLTWKIIFKRFYLEEGCWWLICSRKSITNTDFQTSFTIHGNWEVYSQNISESLKVSAGDLFSNAGSSGVWLLRRAIIFMQKSKKYDLKKLKI